MMPFASSMSYLGINYSTLLLIGPSCLHILIRLCWHDWLSNFFYNYLVNLQDLRLFIIQILTKTFRMWFVCTWFYIWYNVFLFSRLMFAFLSLSCKSTWLLLVFSSDLIEITGGYYSSIGFPSVWRNTD